MVVVDWSKARGNENGRCSMRPAIPTATTVAGAEGAKESNVGLFYFILIIIVVVVVVVVVIVVVIIIIIIRMQGKGL